MVSFETPEYTGDINALGTLRILEAIRLLGLSSKTKFLSGFVIRIIWFGAERPQTEERHFILGHLRSCKIICLLDHNKLSRGI